MQSSQEPSDAAGFAATRWTVVLAAAQGDDSASGSKALTELCHTYWYPLYAFIRRRGHDLHEAEDLVQEFFTRLLAKDFFRSIDREKGKFRAFLLASMKHFLANAWDQRQAQKRGGGKKPISLDALAADSRYGLEPSHQLTPDRLFERQWALTLLGQVLSRLQEEFIAEEKGELFNRLKPYLTSGSGTTSYGQVAQELGMTEGAIKVAVHRLRRRYRELLRQEISQTVADPSEVDDEIRYLLSCL